MLHLATSAVKVCPGPADCFRRAPCQSARLPCARHLDDDKESFEYMMTEHLRMGGVYWGVRARSSHRYAAVSVSKTNASIAHLSIEHGTEQGSKGTQEPRFQHMHSSQSLSSRVERCHFGMARRGSSRAHVLICGPSSCHRDVPRRCGLQPNMRSQTLPRRRRCCVPGVLCQRCGVQHLSREQRRLRSKPDLRRSWCKC